MRIAHTTSRGFTATFEISMEEWERLRGFEGQILQGNLAFVHEDSSAHDKPQVAKKQLSSPSVHIEVRIPEYQIKAAGANSIWLYSRCKERLFAEFLGVSVEDCADELKQTLGIQSRREMDLPHNANKMATLVKKYSQWVRLQAEDANKPQPAND